MADLSGPCSTLPGSFHSNRVKPGDTCDDHEQKHEERAAVACIQGETDSFGAEYTHMCQECLDEYRNRDRTAENTGMCDWCKKHATDLRYHRDFEEGSCGPMYHVCAACRQAESDRLQEELDESDDGWDGDSGCDDDDIEDNDDIDDIDDDDPTMRLSDEPEFPEPPHYY